MMRKKQFVIKITFVILAALGGIVVTKKFLSTILAGLLIGGIFFPALSPEFAEKNYQKDKESLLLVCNYFIDSKYDNIYVPFSLESGMISISGQHVKIENMEVSQAIDTLKRKGYSVIGKKANTIYFQIWSNLDAGRGIAYSLDGEQITLQFLTKSEPLSEENWYYYEEDFNEWKKIQE